MTRREFLGGFLLAPFVAGQLMEGSSMTDSKGVIGREVMWRRVKDDLSFEQARLVKTETGPKIAGRVLIAQNESPLQVSYRVACDPSWQTWAVEIRQTWRGVCRTVSLERDGDGRWQRDGREEPSLMGCTDVDLGISPSTNALPVNRLHLPIDGSSEIKAAWIRFPELEIAPVDQLYLRLAEARYQYRNLASGFTAVIDVDADGLPIDYADVWRMIAKGEAAPESASANFVRALTSNAPSPELGERAEDFGWLIGGWTAEVSDFDPDGRIRQGKGEWWFTWALEGRAIQDVWICPPRMERMLNASMASDSGYANNRYGATVRWFDREQGLWRIVWVNPVSGALNTLAGKREGDRIVLLGKQDGSSTRWSFNEIRPDSFTWRGETCQEDGRWRLSAEFKLRRID